ncbi:putative vacuolar amino acid transporter YPQ1 [Vanrija pseudolonga]|uniref:Vacuolar amino acid transporter YPQ1 n=1 Tax=Vanrija pseudolonga TaxID=143232 RepID=A0AAF0Y704_9TREE|nr:putative vacuolar amino acid transporter YPQ1 [Vanrija pseudolonga]
MSAPVIENYVLKSGEGLSVAFIVIWLLGDLTNLAGGVLAGVLPTMILIAVYYTACDILLLFQVYYYRWRKRQREVAESEHQPLLNNPEPPKTFNPGIPMWISYPLLILFVIVSGFAAYYISPKEDDSPEKGPSGTVEFEWRSQVLGYASCLLYIGSRIPQIFHNFKTRCEGLSLAMFFFSISGNVTYVASIMFKSMDRKYLITNASWIAGAGLTIFLDLFVLGQFAYYAWQDRQKDAKVFADDVEDVTA